MLMETLRFLFCFLRGARLKMGSGKLAPACHVKDKDAPYSQHQVFNSTWVALERPCTEHATKATFG